MHPFIEEIKIIQPKKLFFIDKPIELCRLPYPGHKNGCPNIIKNTNLGISEYKKNIDCPPFAIGLKDRYDLSKIYFLCYVKFNLKKQKEKMKLLHPEWSDKKCKCLFYWQKSCIKELKKKCNTFVRGSFPPNDKYFGYELIPEAMGLDVFKTMKNCGIELERNPENYVYKIAFIGVLKNGI